MSSSSNSNAIFTGTSTYSNDFQQIIDRAVGIASLPLSQLNNQKTALSGQSSELSTIASKFSALQTAIDNLSNATGASSFVASASNSSLVHINIGSGSTFQGTVNVEVDSLGAHTNTLSPNTLTPVTDPSSGNLSSSTSFTLTVDNQTFTITPASGSLSALAQAINNSGAGVQASVVNLGSNGSPDYRLSVQSVGLKDEAIQLNDGSQDLLSTLSHGSPATYRINGQPTDPIQSDSRTITISPGFTVDLLDTGITDINVTRTTASVSNALSAFASAYNAVTTELDSNRGGAGGALTGGTLIYSLSQTLRQLTSFSSGGAISSLGNLGLAFDKDGNLNFDQTTFNNSAQDIDGIVSFLGATGQSGFLKTAGDILDSVDNATNGILTGAITSVNNQILDQNNRIDATQTRIDLMKDNLTAKIAAADAAIAALQQQAIFFNGLFTAFNNANNNNK